MSDWVYKVTVPADKSFAFVRALYDLDLIDDENFEVLYSPEEEEEK